MNVSKVSGVFSIADSNRRHKYVAKKSLKKIEGNKEFAYYVKKKYESKMCLSRLNVLA